MVQPFEDIDADWLFMSHQFCWSGLHIELMETLAGFKNLYLCMFLT